LQCETSIQSLLGSGAVFPINGKLRDELLNEEIFYTLKEALILIESWRQHYNTVRPHSSLGYIPPAPETICREVLPDFRPPGWRIFRA
jgi:transposase InsO family protein